MPVNFSPKDIWADVVSVRQGSPLVHSITNLVVINFNANVLLAMGASPVMAHAHEEVCDMVAISQALVLSIGALDQHWIKSIQLAFKAASRQGIPTCLTRWVLAPRLIEYRYYKNF